MYDSVTATDIPLSAELVAGYCDGPYAWSAADWHRFAQATCVRITITAAANDGHVLDVETGDATPAQAPGWVLMRRAAGVTPSVYMNASTWPAVRDAFAAQHVDEPPYWVAAYDGDPHIPPGAVAHQWVNQPGSGGHYDLSTVADYWPGVDPAPEDLMLVSFQYPVQGGPDAGAVGVFLSDGVHFWHATSAQQLADAQAVAGNDFRRPVVAHQPDAPVADPGAFGRPADAETAAAAGMAWSGASSTT